MEVNQNPDFFAFMFTEHAWKLTAILGMLEGVGKFPSMFIIFFSDKMRLPRES